MTTLLPATKQPRRRTQMLVISAKLWRRAGAPNWMLTISKPGDRITLATHTPHEAAAREFALCAVRNFTSLITSQAQVAPVQPGLF